MNVEDQRNRQGLTALRARYIRRSEVLLNDKQFLTFIEDERKKWNRAFDPYQIIRQVPPDDAELHPPSPYLIFSPSGLREDFQTAIQEHGPVRGVPFEDIRQAIDTWNGQFTHSLIDTWEEEDTRSLVDKFFPARHYFNHRTVLNHPALPFLSACFIFYPRLLESHLDSLYPPFRLHPEQRFVDRSEQWKGAHARGERDHFQAVLMEVLADRPDELQRVLDGARQAGYKRAKDEFPEGFRFFDPNGWYLPIVPLMSGRDIDEVKTELIERSFEVYGAQPINDLIRELKRTKQTLSNQRIAELLGISKDTVDAAL